MITLSKKLKKAQENNNQDSQDPPPRRFNIRDRLLQNQVCELTSDVLPASASVEFPNPNALHQFRVLIRPGDGLWAGGRFVFDVNVPEEYNMAPPKVRCLTRLWHPNISEEGDVCLSLLRQNSLDAMGWTPSRSLKDVVLGLDALFGDLLNFDDPLNQDAARQWTEHRPAFEKKAREYVATYAQQHHHHPGPSAHKS